MGGRAGRALNLSCFYTLLLFLSFTQFAKRQHTLQENRKILILKDLSWSRPFFIPVYASVCNQWKTKWIRHLGLVLHVKGFHATRIGYYANSHWTLQQMRPYKIANIDINPGPDECSMCTKCVARNHWAVSCDNCNMWCHIKCVSIKPSEYKNYQGLPSFSWWCLYLSAMRQHWIAGLTCPWLYDVTKMSMSTKILIFIHHLKRPRNYQVWRSHTLM